jgi:hypothetical protein
MNALPTLTEIEAAKALIRPHIRETPTYRWPLLEAGLGVRTLGEARESHARRRFQNPRRARLPR